MAARYLGIIVLLWLGAAGADDGRGLQRGADAQAVSLSGVSSGAAMAVQYAVAHSASVSGVATIAGPAWGCAQGRVAQAINDCMCGRSPIPPQVTEARALATGRNDGIDALNADRPTALKTAYVFHSASDRTVVGSSGQASIAFLSAFIGRPAQSDWGTAGDGSNAAGHGILSPDGSDTCAARGSDKTYVRRCGAKDNAGDLFHALYPETRRDPAKRIAAIPDSDIWQFDQRRLVQQVRAGGPTIASDRLLFGLFPYQSARRKNFDLADTGYLYVPPSCRQAGSRCRVHVALHGCKQDARKFAATAGYNNWAEHYRVIVVYPAIQPDAALGEEVCHLDPIPSALNNAWIEPNPNGCWDWWGYLDTGLPANRYLTKSAPQMQVIERIIAEVTAPVR